MIPARIALSRLITSMRYRIPRARKPERTQPFAAKAAQPDSALPLAAVGVGGSRPRVAEDAERRAPPDAAGEGPSRGNGRRRRRLIALNLDVAVEPARERPASLRTADVERLEGAVGGRHFLRLREEPERCRFAIGV